MLKRYVLKGDQDVNFNFLTRPLTNRMLKIPDSLAEACICLLLQTLQGSPQGMSSDWDELLQIFKRAGFFVLLSKATGQVERLKQDPVFSAANARIAKLATGLQQQTVAVSLLEKLSNKPPDSILGLNRI